MPKLTSNDIRPRLDNNLSIIVLDYCAIFI